jgi:hypothetical protein
VKGTELLAQMPQESKLGITPQLTRKTTVNFHTEAKGRVGIIGCDILPNAKLVFTEREGKRLLMFSNNGNYEKDIVRFSGIPFGVSYTGENIASQSVHVMVSSRNDMFEDFQPGILTRSINLPLGSKQMRAVQHFFSLCITCKLCYWTLSGATEN